MSAAIGARSKVNPTPRLNLAISNGIAMIRPNILVIADSGDKINALEINGNIKKSNIPLAVGGESHGCNI